MKLPWMSGADRRRWQAAGSLDDLGVLMALWLEGSLESRPGYQARFGPDEETAGLIPVLAACNRAGFVTDCSQPGEVAEGPDGRPWIQRAAVSGFIGDSGLLSRVRAEALAVGLVVVADVANGRCEGTVVTQWGGLPHTGFGWTMPPREVRHMFQGCSRQAMDALVGAWQVAVIDPVWGRNSVLWPALRRAVGRRVAA